MLVVNQSGITDTKFSDSDTDNSSTEEWNYVTARTYRGSPSSNSYHEDIKDPKIRVVNYSIVLATELPPELNTPKTISRDNYMGKYGKVKQVIISSDHSSYVSYNGGVQAYVTYDNQLDAALAIAALKLYKHGTLLTKSSYGTVKYCQKFIAGLKCENEKCFYLHEKHLEDHVTGNLKQNYKRHQERAYKVIRDNLLYFIKKEYDEFKQSKKRKYEEKEICSCNSKSLWAPYVIFPSVKQTLIKLILQGTISGHKYEVEKGLYKSKIYKNSLKKQPSYRPKVAEDEHEITTSKRVIHQNMFIRPREPENMETLLMKTILADEVSINSTTLRKKQKEQESQMSMEDDDTMTQDIRQYIFKNLIKRTLTCQIYPVSRLEFTTRPDRQIFKRQALKLRSIIQTCMIN